MLWQRLCVALVLALALESVAASRRTGVHAAYAPTNDAGDIVIARFAHPFTRPRLAHLSAIVGYDVRPYRQDGNALALYVNASTAARLSAAADVRALGHMPIAMRIDTANVKHVVDARRVATPRTVGERGYLNAAARPLPRTAAAEHVVDVLVLLHAGACTSTEATEEVLSHVVAYLGDAAVWHRGSPTTLIVRAVAIDALEALVDTLVASSPAVYRVEPLAPAMLANLWSASSMQTYPAMSHTNVASADACSDTVCRPLNALGLTGAGQIITVIDTGVDVSSIYFRDSLGRAVPYSSSTTRPPPTGHENIGWYRSISGDYVDSNQHGTHCSGTACGRATGIADNPSAIDAPDFNGAAPGALLFVGDIQAGGENGPLVVERPIGERLFVPFYAEGSRIFSCSFGMATFVGYTTDMREVDAFLYDHQDAVIFAAAGNEYAAYGDNSLIAFSRAKNVADVGANMNGLAVRSMLVGPAPAFGAATYEPTQRAAFSSSGGPAQGSWFGPRFTAPGDIVISSAPSSGASASAPLGAHVTALSGTSMATPGAAGTAALVRQFYLEHRGFGATGPLVLATMAASARPLTGMYPNQPLPNAGGTYGTLYAAGYGRLDVAWALESSIVLSNGEAPFTASGQVRRFCVRFVNDGEGGLPAHVSVMLTYYDPEGPTLVNDLDLEVRTDAGVSVGFPNNLTTADAGSPYERLDFATPFSGRFEVVVRARSIQFGTQPYALLVVAERPAPVNVTVNGAVAPANPAFLTLDTNASGTCATCGGVYEPVCSTCGNGVVEAGEECDPVAPAACCEPSTCRFRADGRLCTRDVETCLLSGTCAGGAATCTLAPGAACSAPTPAPTAPESPSAPVSVCTKSVHAVMADVAASGLYANGTDDICCTSPADVAAAYAGTRAAPYDPRFMELARAVLATRANVRAGVVLESTTFAHLLAAVDLLESACENGFLHRPSARRTAYLLLDELDDVNTGTCAGTGALDTPAAASVCGGTTAAAAYCSSAGTYVAADDTCTCDTGRAGAACERVACNARGFLDSDAAAATTCTCLAGWSAASGCTTCAASPTPGTTYLCVGLVGSRVPAANAGTLYALAAVLTTSVADRRSGAAYTTPGAKAADVTPGTNGLDCACLATTPTSFTAALAADATRGDLIALASPPLKGSVPTSSAPTTSAATRQTVPFWRRFGW